MLLVIILAPQPFYHWLRFSLDDHTLGWLHSHCPSAPTKPESTEEMRLQQRNMWCGARGGDGPGTISGRGGRCLSSVAAGRPCDRLQTLVRARWWGEDAARNPRGPGWRELAGTFGCPWGGSGTEVPSGWKWNRSQPCQGASELGFPRPMLGKMQSEAARRAGEPSRQGEDSPSEGFGCHDLLAQTDARCPAG